MQVLEGVQSTLFCADDAAAALAGVDMYSAAQQAYKLLTAEVRPHFEFSTGESNPVHGVPCQPHPRRAAACRAPPPPLPLAHHRRLLSAYHLAFGTILVKSWEHSSRRAQDGGSDALGLSCSTVWVTMPMLEVLT